MAAPKGNKYAIGNSGRPPKYKTAKALLNKINEYFRNGVEEKEVIIGRGDNRELVKVAVPTITGLCIYLGFETRQAFYHLENKDEFSYIIKKARLFIEKHYEELLQVGNTTGAIFALKNMGWIDQNKLDLSNTDGTLSLSPEERQKKLAELKAKMGK
jgi:hypothetical protein